MLTFGSWRCSHEACQCLDRTELVTRSLYSSQRCVAAVVVVVGCDGDADADADAQYLPV